MASALAFVFASHFLDGQNVRQRGQIVAQVAGPQRARLWMGMSAQ